MSSYEKLGYLKGLLDGLEIDKNSDQGKIYAAITATLQGIIEDSEDLRDDVDMLQDDISDLYDNIDEPDFDYDDDDGQYVLHCPECGEEITVDADDITEDGIECPNCGAYLKFEIDDDDDDSTIDPDMQ